MEIGKQIERIEKFEKIEGLRTKVEDTIAHHSLEDNVNRFGDDSVKNFTRAIVNNSGNGNVSVIYYEDKKQPEESNSHVNKISKVGIIVNLMLLFSLFLNM